MATPRSQRIVIWVIAIVMMIGTLGSFFVMILSSQNQKNDELKYQKLLKDYQTKVDTQTKTLSDKYYTEFNQYSTIPAAFAPGDIKELVKNDLKIGDGDEIKLIKEEKASDGTVLNIYTEYSAYYIGWNPKGIVFDQSISNSALIAPYPGGGTQNNIISGWQEGVVGMKIGGVRELTIPSDKAYGATAKSEDIPANTPLKFIIMLVPRATDVPMTDDLKNYLLENNTQ